MNNFLRKKKIWFAAAALLLPCLSGCSQEEESTSVTLRVGVVKYSQNDPFINAMADILKEDLNGMETDEMKIIVSVRSGDENQRDQNKIVEEMIDAGCDILCVNLVDRTSPSTIIKMAKDENIPVIFFNREPVKEDLLQWEKLYYVGNGAEQSGRLQGEAAASYIKEHPEVDKNGDGVIQYVVLKGEEDHQDTIIRTDYAVNTLMEGGVELEKLSYQFANWSRTQAENRMTKLIGQYGDSIELVLSNNDEMALGAVEAYKAKNYDKSSWPIIYGINGLNDALEAVEKGEIQGTIYNDKEDQAREMAILATKIFQGEDLSSAGLVDGTYYTSQYQLVDSSNVDEFLQK